MVEALQERLEKRRRSRETVSKQDDLLSAEEEVEETSLSQGRYWGRQKVTEQTASLIRRQQRRSLGNSVGAGRRLQRTEKPKSVTCTTRVPLPPSDGATGLRGTGHRREKSSSAAQVRVKRTLRQEVTLHRRVSRSRSRPLSA